jgi:hypothetical protein
VPKQQRNIPSFLKVTFSGPGRNQVRTLDYLPDDALFANVSMPGETISFASFNVNACNPGSIELFWRLIDAFETLHRHAFQDGRRDVIERVKDVFKNPRVPSSGVGA